MNNKQLYPNYFIYEWFITEYVIRDIYTYDLINSDVCKLRSHCLVSFVWASFHISYREGEDEGWRDSSNSTASSPTLINDWSNNAYSNSEQ